MPNNWPWTRKSRKSNQSQVPNTPEIPQALPDPGTSQNYPSVQLPERPGSRIDDQTNSRLSSPTSSGTAGNTDTTISVAADQASNVTPQAAHNSTPQIAQHSTSQDGGSSNVHAGKKDYWKLAVDELQKEDPSIKGRVDAVQRAAEEAGNADFAAQLLDTTQQWQKVLESKRWKIKLGPREVVLRDHFNGLVNGVSFFKDVGNAVGSVDPVHVGLPLAGFFILIQIATNNSKQYAEITDGVKEIVTIVSRYSITETRLQSRANTKSMQEFDRRLIALYKQIVRYQISATYYYQRNPMNRFARALPKLDDLSPVMATIRQHDEACRLIQHELQFSDASELLEEIVKLQQQVFEILKQLEQSRSNQRDAESPWMPGHKHWLVPRSMNIVFTGRDKLLSDLETIAREAVKDSCRNAQCRVVITGIGGQGKSELCVQLVHRVCQAFWGVFWVDVSTESSAESAFLHIAKQLQIPAQTYGDAVVGLANTQHPWLLVLDNADDPDRDYQDYFPTGNGGVVMLTSRNENCSEYAPPPEKCINLDGLSDDEACELLLRAAKIPHDQYETLEHDAREVAALLQSHPLALIQAASYISCGHSTLTEYPEIFAQKRQRLLKFRPKQAKSRYGDVYATFEASAQILQEAGTEIATDALQLLPVLATFDSNRLPLPLFEAGWKRARRYKAYWSAAGKDGDDDDVDDDTLDITPWHFSHVLHLMQVDTDQSDYSFRLGQAIDLLKAFSLVSTDNLNDFMSVSMHPLVHAWARDRQDSMEQNKSWVAAGCLIGMFPGEDEFWSEHSRQLRPHLHAFTGWDASKLLECYPPKKITTILLKCGWLLYDIHDSAKVHSLMQGLFGHLELDMRTVKGEWIELYGLTARNLVEYGKPNEAIPLSKQIVNSLEQILPEDDADLLWCQHHLAVAYRANKQIQEAISLLLRVVKIQEKTLREDHPERLTSQHELARAYGENGQAQEAIVLLEQVDKIQEQTLREDHPSRLASQHELAGAYQKNGQVQEANVLLEQVVKIKEQILREDHPDRLASQHQLAAVYQANGRAQEAIVLLKQVVEIQEQTLREDHPGRLASQHELARAYQKNGQVQEAIVLLEQVVKIKEQILREDHPERLASQQQLAAAYQANGRVQEAIVLLKQVVEIQEQTLREDHPDRLASQHELARAYQANGQVQEAIVLLKQVVEIREQTLREDHPDRLASQHELAGAYQANGQVQVAIVLLEQVIKIKEQTLREDHPDRLASQYNLATYYWDVGRRNAAYDMMAHVVKIQRQVLRENHPSRINSEEWLDIFQRELDGTEAE